MDTTYSTSLESSPRTREPTNARLAIRSARSLASLNCASFVSCFIFHFVISCFRLVNISINVMMSSSMVMMSSEWWWCHRVWWWCHRERWWCHQVWWWCHREWWWGYSILITHPYISSNSNYHTHPYAYSVTQLITQPSFWPTHQPSIYSSCFAALVSEPELDLTKVMEPPQFVRPIYGLDVVEGGQAMFEVVVSGQPMPDITWYHEGHQIQHGPDFQVRYFNCMTLSKIYNILCLNFYVLRIKNFIPIFHDAKCRGSFANIGQDNSWLIIIKLLNYSPFCFYRWWMTRTDSGW